MKVLSLTETYATLIKENKKSIETRSWRTSYRGELYIHSSSTKIPKGWKENKELMNLINNTSLNFGDIICKCNLVDCIYMTKEYVENMKNNNYMDSNLCIYNYSKPKSNITVREFYRHCENGIEIDLMAGKQ